MVPVQRSSEIKFTVDNAKGSEEHSADISVEYVLSRSRQEWTWRIEPRSNKFQVGRGETRWQALENPGRRIPGPGRCKFICICLYVALTRRAVPTSQCIATSLPHSCPSRKSCVRSLLSIPLQQKEGHGVQRRHFRAIVDSDSRHQCHERRSPLRLVRNAHIQQPLPHGIP